MSVECVTFGVRLNDGPEWPARARILLGPIKGPYESLTLISENFADLNTVLSSFNTAPPNPGYNPAADFDADGGVDFADLNVLLGAFNTTC